MARVTQIQRVNAFAADQTRGCGQLLDVCIKKTFSFQAQAQNTCRGCCITDLYSCHISEINPEMTPVLTPVCDMTMANTRTVGAGPNDHAMTDSTKTKCHFSCPPHSKLIMCKMLL